MYKCVKSVDENIEIQNAAMKNIELQMGQLESMMLGNNARFSSKNTKKNPNFFYVPSRVRIVNGHDSLSPRSTV